MLSPQNSSVLQVVLEQSRRVLETYRIDPGLIQEHANGERRITQGGYGDRQIYELVQNGADELRHDPGGRISVVLTRAYLYCANQGAAMTPEGADTILRMSVSRKRGGQIGRFGVGVKSVLAITDSPQFFSRDDDKSFGFDREWATEEIKAVRPDAEEIPVLRMAQPLDRDKAAAADPVLAELLEWATTVVRLPLKPSQVDRLGKDLEAFPDEFSLFSPHVGTVILEDRRSARAVTRQIFQRIDGDRRTLTVKKSPGGTKDESWRVFSRTHRPSTKALGEAGELHDRPEIDVSWAVPDRTGRETGLGEFWAYFPTNFKTTLRGIINAPWKTSEDRQNLYDANAFNKELIQVAAGLVVDSLPLLSRADDRCAYLDQVPARGREEPQFAATELVRTIWEIAAVRSTLVDQDGRFGTATEVRLHPEDLREEWRELWAGYPGRPRNWCHHSVERTPHRRQSAERILSIAKVPVASVREWLEALVQDESPEASARAIRIVADMKSRNHRLSEEALKAKVILTEAHGLVAPSPKVFRRTSTDSLSDQMVYVDDRVLADDSIRRRLDELGVHEADAAGRFASVLEQGFFGYGDVQWTAFWELSRQAGPADTLAALRAAKIDAAGQLKVRTVSGEFRPISECLLPGKVVPADGSRDARIAVDLNFHDSDRIILRDLGLLDGPVTSVDPTSEPWYREYTEKLWNLYCKRLPASTRGRPQLTTMRFDGAAPAGPLHFLTELSSEGRAAFLQHIPSHGLVTKWTMEDSRQRSTRQAVVSPLVWMARTHGRLQTSWGIRPVRDCVSPLLRQYADVLPVADVPVNLAEVLRLPTTLGDVQAQIWSETVKKASASQDDSFPGRVYALLFEAGAAWPEGATTRCKVGDEWTSDQPDGEIAVTANRAEYDALVRERIPALLAPTSEAAEQMRETWGMLDPSAVIQKEVRFVPQEEPVLLAEEFPHLRVQHRAKVDGWHLVRCDELEEITRTPHGMRTTSVKAAIHERSVLVLKPADDLAALMAVDRELKLGLGRYGCEGIIQRREQQRNNERLRRAREAADTASKVLELVGEEALRRGLPQGLVESEQAESGRVPDARRIAELAVHAHGPAILRHYNKDIAANVPEAAGSFSGDNRSMQIVNQLRLPESFAGARAQRLDPTEVISGPTEFPRLHDYQERLASNMFDLLTRYRAGRGMLCLPTGAGKTRVAVEAVIRVIKEQGLQRRPVLWIAQTEELCEQAVQSWKFVWSKVGPEDRLTISRLWSGNEAAAVRDTHHLVVATDAKLERCLDTSDYEWLRDAALVLIDEAHTSITPRYTQLLASLGITYRSSERPLIGLTATPFRGFNVEETRRLVDRYGKTRLDDGIFESDDPYAELQKLGVLAQVEHRELKGATIKLTAGELANIDFQGRLPAAVEEQLAQDQERNDMLIDEILNLPDDGPVLLFATSVNHAKLMAARLTGKGVEAEAVDAATPASERRAIVERFRSGRTRVLTNYGVLAQGFDAPATRTVVVARPTYSPNVYQQMIGRGLRGPRNGGKETCLILDVHDNITNYDKQLAFTGFEHLWSRK
ncbi:DEAD/DEAH box helicase [Planomonospora sp. ID82291]|uniref:DEAD/DEAH box helicase n=1 Tax=Planomonospora sp. ID82291 TaxID=2738136 RepID=UPI001A245F8B|nr:DEAD/DEAH box helicase [Planomonospora sp. ID82291]MBG0814843.1 DEAD/DEAH box helicase [Planomonospora sp. ID82291]